MLGGSFDPQISKRSIPPHAKDIVSRLYKLIKVDKLLNMAADDSKS